jgi:polar amino acid transport system substrate-binding protein
MKPFHRYILLVVFGLLTSSITMPLAGQDTPLKVAIKPLTPFVIYNSDGSYSGFSIELWNEIARRMTARFEYLPLETVTEVLEAVREKQADVGIAGISITREREEFVDFSQPMFNSGLKIMTAAQGSSPGLAILLQLLSPDLLVVLLILLAITILVGHLVWIFERHNPEFPDNYFPGVGEGIWWAASSLIGGSDKMPRSVTGRVGAIIWVVTGIILISLFTANLTAENTIQQLESNIRGVDDLPGKRIVTVEGTTAAQFLQEQRLLFTTVPTIEDAYPLLLNQSVEAIVYDAPVLQYYALTAGKGRVTVTGSLFERQDYGIALPSGSPNRELIDRALLAILEEGGYDTLYQKWFGET